MATIDIGKIKPVFKGTYDNSTAYVLDDIVYYNGSSYVAKTSTTGNLPTDTTKWNILASGSGGIWDSTLSLGSAGQAVKVNSGGTALEFGAVAGGKVLQVQYGSHEPQASTTSTNPVDVSSSTNVSITPSATTSKILVLAHFNECYHNSGTGTTSHYIRVTRAGTQIHKAHTIYAAGLTGEEMWNQDLIMLDQPNTTSATEYKLQFWSANGSTVKVNQNSNPGGTTITLMEIGA